MREGDETAGVAAKAPAPVTLEGLVRKLLALNNADGLTTSLQVGFTLTGDGMKLKASAVLADDGKVVQSVACERTFASTLDDGNVGVLVEYMDATLRQRLEQRAERIRNVLGEGGGA